MDDKLLFFRENFNCMVKNINPLVVVIVVV